MSEQAVSVNFTVDREVLNGFIQNVRAAGDGYHIVVSADEYRQVLDQLEAALEQSEEQE
jgi:hypothetical protein